MNKGQCTAGPAGALRVLFVSGCRSLPLLHVTGWDIPRVGALNITQLWPSTDVSWFSLRPGFVFSTMSLSLVNMGQMCTCSHSAPVWWGGCWPGHFIQTGRGGSPEAVGRGGGGGFLRRACSCEWIPRKASDTVLLVRSSQRAVCGWMMERGAGGGLGRCERHRRNPARSCTLCL